MNHAIVVSVPIYRRLTSHLTEDDVNMFHGLAASAFKNTIGDTSPSVASRELDLDAEYAKHYVRKNIRMGIEIHSEAIWRNQPLENLAHPGLELSGLGKLPTGTTFRSEFGAKFSENTLEAFRC